MKISLINNYNLNNKRVIPVRKQTVEQIPAYSLDERCVDSVCFRGIKSRRVNIEVEKQKLLKSITKLLDTDSSSKVSKFDMETAGLRSLLYLESKDRKMDFLVEQAKVIANVNFSNPTMQYEMRQRLWNEAKKVQKDANNYVAKTSLKQKKTATNEIFDYVLLNKFKSAIMNDNFDLQGIAKEHYSLLLQIDSKDKLVESYPILKSPATPESVVVQNLLKGLSRDFYEELDNLYNQNDMNEVSFLLTNVLMSACVYLTEKYSLIYKNLPEKISSLFAKSVMEKYYQSVNQGSFSIFPNYIKKIPQFATQLDLDLMQVDFNKFVIEIYRQQFIEQKKFNDIVYEENGRRIPARILANSPYKFEKVSEKIKKIMREAEQLKLAQRDYDNFTIEELKSRLNYFSNHPLCNDDKIFESIMEFYSSAFLPEDVKNLVLLLKDLDLLIDKKKSLAQVLSDIHDQKLKPIGTQKQNEIHRKEIFEKVKADQQKAYELLILQESFDRVINTLYTFQMNSVAGACSDFRPQSLDDKQNIERAQFLIEYTNNNLVDGKITNKNKFESDIFYWDVYNQYKAAAEYNKYPKYVELIKKSEQYSLENKQINSIKAGQYIFNMEIITTYPQSLEVMEDPELLTRIMEKTNSVEEKALALLVKYDSYKNLTDEDQCRIDNILEIFDEKDPIEKSIAKYIIESEYIKHDTFVHMIDSKNNDPQIVVIAEEAKQQIYDKYRFPKCIDLFEAFESAAQNFTTEYGNSGIKRFSSVNSSLPYNVEIKIKGYPDRLFSSKNDYRFDIYSEKGLH